MNVFWGSKKFSVDRHPVRRAAMLASAWVMINPCTSFAGCEPVADAAVTTKPTLELMNLTWIFVLCATCGFGLAILIFAWPVYRLLELSMIGLTAITWRFAFDLEPFRRSFPAHRLQRQFSESMQREKKRQPEEAHSRFAAAKTELEESKEDLDEFVYAASHDLQSPLRAINSLSQFVADDLGEDANDQVLGDLGKMQSRVKRILDGLLNHSRVGRVQYDLETFEIDEAIKQAVAILDIPETFRIQFDKCSLVSTSPKPLLEQVLRDLVDNAVRNHPRKDGIVKIKAEPMGNSIQFSISDDGDGIPEEYQEQISDIFKALRRRDELEANGMGLVLVKRIIERQGAAISVDSSEGQGSTFRFTWPSEEKLSFTKLVFLSAARNKKSCAMCDQTVSILLAEDHDIDVRVVKRSLAKKKLDHPVVVARDGVKVLSLLRGENGKPSALATFDGSVGSQFTEEGGLELLEELRNDLELAKSIVFVLTTSNDDRDRTAAYENHVAGYLLKTEAGNEMEEHVPMLKDTSSRSSFPRKVA